MVPQLYIFCPGLPWNCSCGTRKILSALRGTCWIFRTTRELSYLKFRSSNNLVQLSNGFAVHLFVTVFSNFSSPQLYLNWTMLVFPLRIVSLIWTSQRNTKTCIEYLTNLLLSSLQRELEVCCTKVFQDIPK